MAQITKDTGIIEAVQKYPQIIEIFQQYGLGCIGCMAAHFETIGQGAVPTASTSTHSLLTSMTASLKAGNKVEKSVVLTDNAFLVARRSVAAPVGGGAAPAHNSLNAFRIRSPVSPLFSGWNWVPYTRPARTAPVTGME